jgi:hypothetical protein
LEQVDEGSNCAKVCEEDDSLSWGMLGGDLHLRIPIPLLGLEERLPGSLGVGFLPCFEVPVSCLYTIAFQILEINFLGERICGSAAIDASQALSGCRRKEDVVVWLLFRWRND